MQNLSTHTSLYGLTTDEIMAPGPGGHPRRMVVTFIPEGEQAIRELGGPMVPGPWGFVTMTATVIAANPIRWPEPELALELGEPFTVDGVPGAWTLRAPGPWEGDAPRVVPAETRP